MSIDFGLQEFATLLGTGFLGGLVSAYVMRANSERRIYIENVTRERAKWRERIRIIASNYLVADNKLKMKLEIELATRLNPYASDDMKLLEALKSATTENHKELEIRIALLLKHDWERAKEEAKPRRMLPVRRVTYEEYMKCYSHYKEGDLSRFDLELQKITKDISWM